MNLDKLPRDVELASTGKRKRAPSLLSRIVDSEVTVGIAVIAVVVMVFFVLLELFN